MGYYEQASQELSYMRVKKKSRISCGEIRFPNSESILGAAIGGTEFAEKTGSFSWSKTRPTAKRKAMT